MAANSTTGGSAALAEADTESERRSPGTSAGGLAATAAAAPKRASSGVVLTLLLASNLIFAVMQSLISPALPAIAKDLHASTGDISWVLTGYLLAASVATPIAAALGDMFGKRRLLLLAIAGGAIGVLISALATNLTMLITGRVVQGLLGAVVPLSISIIRDELPKEKISSAIGLIMGVGGLGGGFGLVMAGPVTDNLSWHWLFWIPLIGLVIPLVGIFVGVPESPVRTPGRIDVLGAGLLATGLVCGLLAVNKGRAWDWTSPRTLGLFACSALALLVWYLVELRVPNPLVDMRMMRIRSVWAAMLAGLSVGFVMFGIFLLIPLLLQMPTATGYGFGRTVSQTGWLLLPLSCAPMLTSPLSAPLNNRFGPRLPLALGAIIAMGSVALLAVGHDNLWQLMVAETLMGAAIGLLFAAMTNAIVEAVPPSQTGIATGINSITRTIGSSIGTAVLAAVLANNTGAHGITTDNGFTVAFWLSTGIAVLTLAAALALPRRRGLG